MKKILPIIIFIFILLISAVAYWLFFIAHKDTSSDQTSSTSGSSGFNPFNRPGTNSNTGNNATLNQNSTSTSQIPASPIQTKIPALRLLSTTPVGGFGASTTASTTIIRWADRGRGNIYEANSSTLDILTLSNTIVPKIYDSLWNRNATAFLASTISDGTNVSSGIYAKLTARPIAKIATSTAPNVENESLSQYELRGQSLPQNIISYAVSPKKDRVFLYINENGTGVGYISSFDRLNLTQLFTSPLTQINVEWPSENIIAVTTKGAAEERGYLYFVDVKSGAWSKILGPLPGLSTRVSTDGKYVLVSSTADKKNISTHIHNIVKNEDTDAVVRTLADKCVWGNFYKEVAYCAVPSQTIPATYPDDWYKGTISTTDQIWQLNANNGNINLISSLSNTPDRFIDGFNLGLDNKDNFLIFMDKNDLSLWSLDLISTN